MNDSTVLVDRLLAADAECKRLALALEESEQLRIALEKDSKSLRGSCAALGEDLRQTRARLTGSHRALSWLMHNRSIPLDGMPGWLMHTLKAVLRTHDKPINKA